MVNGLTLISLITIVWLVMAIMKIRSKQIFWKLQAVELSKKLNDDLKSKQTNKQNSR